MQDPEQLRQGMVEQQIRRRGISDPKVLQAMMRVPRHEFIPSSFGHRAYDDEPVPLPCLQTVSQPYMVAAMAAALKLTGNETVLEIGAGSGYAAAVLSELSHHVYTIERQYELVELARDNLLRTGYGDRVTVVEGDGTLGYETAAPYDAISVAAGAPGVPEQLIEQLIPDGGRLVIPVGDERTQQLRLIRRSPDHMETEVLNQCRFVPLRGACGWKM